MISVWTGVRLIMQVCLILLPGQPSRGESQLVGSGVLLGGETPLGRGGKIQNNEVNQLKWPITRFKHGTGETTVMCSVLQKSRYVTFIGTDINFNFGGDVEDNCYNIQSDVWAQLVDWHVFFFYKCQETKKPKQRRKRSNKQTNNQTSNQQPTDQLTTNNQTTNQHPTNKNCKNVHVDSCYSNSDAHMVIIHLVILWTPYPAGFRYSSKCWNFLTVRFNICRFPIDQPLWVVVGTHIGFELGSDSSCFISGTVCLTDRALAAAKNQALLRLSGHLLM